MVVQALSSLSTAESHRSLDVRYGYNERLWLTPGEGVVGAGSKAAELEQGPGRRPSGLGSHRAPLSVPEI
jgi:hypothetical protein